MLRLKGQKTPNDCAVACLQNALALRGRRVGRRRIIDALGGDLSLGIDAPDIKRALDIFGQPYTECSTSEPAVARGWLQRHAAAGPVIAATRDWEHWELIAGVCGDRLAVHDPETGIYWASLRWFMREWPARATTPRRVGVPGAGRHCAVAI